jgi:hypothetical protein
MNQSRRTKGKSNQLQNEYLLPNPYLTTFKTIFPSYSTLYTRQVSLPDLAQTLIQKGDFNLFKSAVVTICTTCFNIRNKKLWENESFTFLWYNSDRTENENVWWGHKQIAMWSRMHPIKHLEGGGYADRQKHDLLGLKRLKNWGRDTETQR